MNPRLYNVFLAATLAALPSAAAIQQPIKVKTGLVAGAAASDSSITVFKGIPYAAPPVGDLRWRAPRPPAAWQGVRKTDQFSASCVQNIVTERKPWTFEFMAHGEISEDCLYLNIWTPAKSAAAKRPVLLWMYGGGMWRAAPPFRFTMARAWPRKDSWSSRLITGSAFSASSRIPR